MGCSADWRSPVAKATPELLSSSVGRTLEEAAFVFLEPIEGAPPRFSGTLVEARMTFSGEEDGELRIATDEVLAAELAANLLGQDAADPAMATRGGEALGELANVILGTLVVEIYGQWAPCRLGVPDIRTLGADAYDPGTVDDACAVVLVTEGGRRFDAVLRTSERKG